MGTVGGFLIYISSQSSAQLLWILQYQRTAGIEQDGSRKAI